MSCHSSFFHFHFMIVHYRAMFEIALVLQMCMAIYYVMFMPINVVSYPKATFRE